MRLSAGKGLSILVRHNPRACQDARCRHHRIDWILILFEPSLRQATHHAIAVAVRGEPSPSTTIFCG